MILHERDSVLAQLQWPLPPQDPEQHSVPGELHGVPCSPQHLPLLHVVGTAPLALQQSDGAEQGEFSGTQHVQLLEKSQ
jgi:hypothetical protein